MPKTFAQRVAEEQAALRRQSRSATAAPRMQNTSLDDTDLPSFDREGRLKASWGKQPDGSHGPLVRDSGNQPTPTPPILTTGERGAVEAAWDGQTTDFTPPLVHGHIEVHKAHSPDGNEPPLDAYRLASTIRDRDGGATAIACPNPGTWYVRLRMVGQDRTTFGAFSEATAVEIIALRDTEAIAEVIRDAQERINASTAAWQQAKTELQEALAGLNAGNLPGLAEQLSENDQRVQDARNRLASVETEIRVNVDDLAARIATVIALNADRITAGQIGVDRLDVEQFFGNEAVLNLLRAAVIQALEITAETGFIGGALLKDNTIDVGKINVTEELTAAVAQFLYLGADQIDVNNLVAQSALVGLLEAVGLVLSNSAGGRRFEVSGDGWRLIDTTTGQTMAQLGTHGDDLLSLFDGQTGEPTVTMTGAGGLSAINVSTQEDPHFAGKPLAGPDFDTARWHASSSVVSTGAMGVTSDHLRVFANSWTTSSASGMVIVHQDVYVEPGRMYHFVCHDFQMNNKEPYYMQAYYTGSTSRTVRPNLPGPTSASQGPSMGRVPPSSFSGGTSLSYSFFYHNNQNRRMRISWVVGNASTSNSLAFGSSQRNYPRCQVIDMGPFVNTGGTSSIARGIDNTSEGSMVEPSEMLTLAYNTVQTATYTLNEVTGVATRQYFGGEPRFGRWPNGTYYVTVVDYADWGSQPGERTGANFSVRVGSWVTPGGGHIFQASLPNFSGLPASFNLLTDTSGFANPQGVGAGLPVNVTPEGGMSSDLLGRNNASLAIGRTGWSGLSTALPASGTLNTARMFARLHTRVGD